MEGNRKFYTMAKNEDKNPDTDLKLKTFDQGEAVVTATYNIAKISNEYAFGGGIPFIRAHSRWSNKTTDGIVALYVDGEKKRPTTKISLSKGKHVAQIVLEDSTQVPWELFRHAKEIDTIEIPESVTTIGRFAFRWTRLKRFPALPPNLKVVEQCAFDGAYCKKLEDLRLPDSVEMIEREAFEGVTDHLIVGKNFRGDLHYIHCYKKLTIPDDNLYLEVRDGFIYKRGTMELLALMPGAFEDTSESMIRVPEGVTSIDDHAFSHIKYASISIPGSVETCHLEIGGEFADSHKDCPRITRTIELGEGIKDLQIACPHLNIVQIPKSVNRLYLAIYSDDPIVVPDRCKVKYITGRYPRLILGADVDICGRVAHTPTADVINPAFGGPEWGGNVRAEVHVLGPIHFEKWGYMDSRSSIYVPDEETARKILNSGGFNKEVPIYFNNQLFAEQEEGAEDKRIFNLLGCPDFKKPLQSIGHVYGNVNMVFTLLFDLPEKTKVTFDVGYCAYYTIDDKEAKAFRKNTLSIPKGRHIVRLIDVSLYRRDSLNLKIGQSFEPACEAMYICDHREVDFLYKMTGVKHLILGARCDIPYINFPVERVSVVPTNPFLEVRDGCIIHRKTNSLVYISSDATRIADGITEKIEHGVMSNFRQQRLEVPGSMKSLFLSKVDNLKELVIEEGVEDAELMCLNFAEGATISFPSSLKVLNMAGVAIENVTVEHKIELGRFENLKIQNLTFMGDVRLRPSYGSTFNKFSGNIHFRGTVKPKIETVSGKEDPVGFFGKLNDDSTITVADKSTADVIRNCEDFNHKVSIIVKP